jgi:oligogalacturonide lyase
LTRRECLAGGILIPALLRAADQKPRIYPQASELVRVLDPATETPMIRLTSPAHTSLLPASGNRFLSVRQRVLVYSSDRTGKMTPFAMDLRSGVSRQIAAADDLKPATLSLDASGKFVYYLDGQALREVELGGRKEGHAETLLDAVSSFAIGASRAELFAVREGRLVKVENAQGPSAPVAEHAQTAAAVRPGGRGCLFGREGETDEREIWLAAAGVDPLLVARGRVSNPWWSADGESVLFLRDVPVGDVFVSEIHEFLPNSKSEQTVTRTSQFAAFAPNGDDSVFVGASRSKAQPNVVILLRSPQREMTLCEHRASHAGDVRPTFSPDSRRVFFQSDHEGKFAIYSVSVESLVEPTQVNG